MIIKTKTQNLVCIAHNDKRVFIGAEHRFFSDITDHGGGDAAGSGQQKPDGYFTSRVVGYSHVAGGCSDYVPSAGQKELTWGISFCRQW